MTRDLHSCVNRYLNCSYKLGHYSERGNMQQIAANFGNVAIP